jgi:hypothetical protein
VSVAATPHGLTRKSVWRRSKARIDPLWKSPRRTGQRAIPEHRSNIVDVAQGSPHSLYMAEERVGWSIAAIRAGRKISPSFRSEGLIDDGWREMIEVVRNRLQSHTE